MVGPNCDFVHQNFENFDIMIFIESTWNRTPHCLPRVFWWSGNPVGPVNRKAWSWKKCFLSDWWANSSNNVADVIVPERTPYHCMLKHLPDPVSRTTERSLNWNMDIGIMHILELSYNEVVYIYTAAICVHLQVSNDLWPAGGVSVHCCCTSSHVGNIPVHLNQN